MNCLPFQSDFMGADLLSFPRTLLFDHPDEFSMTQGGKPKDVFDIDRIRHIIELMEQHDLSEVDLQQGEEKIKLGRGTSGPTYAPAPMIAPGVAPGGAVSGAADANVDANAGTITIDSPMVGTFYSKAKPESPPFVKVGDPVGPDTIICIIEAMKVFNEIPAECSGKIVEVLVSDQAAVDFGKPMFRVQPDG